MGQGIYLLLQHNLSFFWHTLRSIALVMRIEYCHQENHIGFRGWQWKSIMGKSRAIPISAGSKIRYTRPGWESKNIRNPWNKHIVNFYSNWKIQRTTDFNKIEIILMKRIWGDFEIFLFVFELGLSQKVWGSNWMNWRKTIKGGDKYTPSPETQLVLDIVLNTDLLQTRILLLPLL